jgi:MFS family permease
MKSTIGEQTSLLDTEQIAEDAAVQVFESAITDRDQSDDDEDIRWLREQRLQHRSLQWYRKPTVTLACLILFLYFVSSMIYVASFLQLLMLRACRYEQGLDSTIMCSDPRVQASVSAIQSKVLLSMGTVGIIAGGKIGEMSDRIGRKPLLLFATFTALINKIGDAFLVANSTPFNAWLFALNGAFLGLGGGNVMMISLTSSYVTDIVESHVRTTMLGFVVGSFYAGLGIGPLIGSFIVRRTGDPLNTIYVAIVVNMLLVALVSFGISESRPEKLRTRSQSIHYQRKTSFTSQRSTHYGMQRITEPLFSLINSFGIVKILWLPKHRKLGLIPRFNVIILVAIECLLMSVAISIAGPLVLYAMYKFSIDSEMLGYFISAIGLSKTLVLYLMSPVLLHFLKKRLPVKVSAPDLVDWTVIVIAIVFDLSTPLIVITATTSVLVLGSGVISAMGALATPTIQSAIIKYIPENKTGEMFGALAVLKNILSMVAPSGALYIYSKTVQGMPHLVFYVAGIIVLTCLALVMFVRIHQDIDIGDFAKVRSGSIDSVSSASDNEASIGPSLMNVYSTTRRASTSSPRERLSA